MSKKSSTFAVPFEKSGVISRSRAVVARQAHNLEVVGSIPSSATKKLDMSSFFYYFKSWFVIAQTQESDQTFSAVSTMSIIV